jgi:hypothetical protein
MSTIDKRDITEYAGREWNLPAGVSVGLASVYDEHCEPFEADCYDAAAIEAWRRNEWMYVGLIVTVYGPNGGELGEASVWSFEDGHFPMSDGQSVWLSPIEDENCFGDIVWEAMNQAAGYLKSLQGIEIVEKA